MATFREAMTAMLQAKQANLDPETQRASFDQIWNQQNGWSPERLAQADAMFSRIPPDQQQQFAEGAYYLQGWPDQLMAALGSPDPTQALQATKASVDQRLTQAQSEYEDASSWQTHLQHGLPFIAAGLGLAGAGGAFGAFGGGGSTNSLFGAESFLPELGAGGGVGEGAFTTGMQGFNDFGEVGGWSSEAAGGGTDPWSIDIPPDSAYGGTDWASRAQVGGAEDMFNLAGSGSGAGGGGGSDLLATLKNWGITPGLAASTALNLFQQGRQADALKEVSNQAFQSAPINQPQRAPYQANLMNLMQNPNDFFASNPLFNAQKDQATQAFEAQSAKRGMGGTTINDYMRNIMNTGASTFFDQGNLLATLGGFNQGAGNAGAGTQAGIAAANAGSNMITGSIPLVSNVANSQGASDAFASLYDFSKPNPISGSTISPA